MKFIFIFLLVLIITTAVTLLALNEPGYALLGVGRTAIQMSLLYFILILSALFILFYILLSAIFSMWKAPGAVRKSFHAGQLNKARKGLTSGLLEMAEGNWKKAEKLLSASASKGETPLLNYLAAAHSAERQNDFVARDKYLGLAAAIDPGAEIAVGLTQVELQLKKGQQEEALATLQTLRSNHPQHPQVLKQLARLLFERGQWQQLIELLPEIKKNQMMSDTEKGTMETQSWSQLIAESGKMHDRKGIDQIWKKLGKSEKGNIEILGSYCLQLIRLKDSNTAESLLRKALNSNWNKQLAAIYGELQLDNPTAAIRQAEKWLLKHPGSAEILAAAGRLNAQAKVWGKAKSLLQESLKLRPNAITYQAMAELYESLGEDEAAKNTYQEGLRFVTQETN